MEFDLGASFGRDDPRRMPAHLFPALHLGYDSAVRANSERQNCSNEEYGFWVDSTPKHCLECRRLLRAAESGRQEYDRSIARVLQSGTIEDKRRLAAIIDQLYEIGGELPDRINENRRRLAKDISG